jgi:hypothetical protein
MGLLRNDLILAINTSSCGELGQLGFAISRMLDSWIVARVSRGEAGDGAGDSQKAECALNPIRTATSLAQGQVALSEAKRPCNSKTYRY